MCADHGLAVNRFERLLHALVESAASAMLPLDDDAAVAGNLQRPAHELFCWPLEALYRMLNSSRWTAS